jgi:hypothetical protein
MKNLDYNFCNKIVQIPLNYVEEKPRTRKNYKSQKKNLGIYRTKRRYFLRRSDNKAPFLHKRNIRQYNPRKNYDKTCRCFICNSPDHLSKRCPNKDQKSYSSNYEEQERVLIVDSVNENILVCDDEIKDDESIYSIIETDEIENNEQEYDSSNDGMDFIDELAGLTIEMMNQVSCNHDWIRGKGNYNIKCIFCIYYPSQENRVTCSLCLKQACVECLKTKNQNWRKQVELESEERIISHHVRTLENRLNKLEIELEEFKNKVECDHILEDKTLQNIECQEQSIAIFENKNDKIIQLKDAITSFGSK